MKTRRALIPIRNILIPRLIQDVTVSENDTDYFRFCASRGFLFEDPIVYPISGSYGGDGEMYALVHGRKIYEGLRFISEKRGREDIKTVCKVVDQAVDEGVAALIYLAMNRTSDVSPFTELQMIRKAMESNTLDTIVKFSGIPVAHIENLLIFYKMDAKFHVWVRSGLISIFDVLDIIQQTKSYETTERILDAAREIIEENGMSDLSTEVLDQAFNSVVKHAVSA